MTFFLTLVLSHTHTHTPSASSHTATHLKAGTCQPCSPHLWREHLSWTWVFVRTIFAASSRSSQARIFSGLAAIRALASSTLVPENKQTKKINEKKSVFQNSSTFGHPTAMSLSELRVSWYGKHSFGCCWMFLNLKEANNLLVVFCGYLCLLYCPPSDHSFHLHSGKTKLNV